ncbi:MAG: hypothetical protein DYH13_10855 [Alphaproteobacteria bacterium PRO2]|nr:hypothetical protein [Alphaproteobacteria bacterium PRO2]
MVEGPKGIGSLQNLISGTRVTEASNRRTDDVKSSPSPKDEVNLSPEAISLGQAQETASSVRESLSRYTDVTLSSGQNFDESL